MVTSAVAAISNDQIKAIRRREYYNRRVKADFAPKNEEILEGDPSTEGEESQGGPQSPFSQKQKQLNKEKRKKSLADKQRKTKFGKIPEWNKHVNLEPTKAKYVK